MKSGPLRTVLSITALILGYYGFRFVTQAGQGLGVVQNDGYGGTGGLMILAAGFLLGLVTVTSKDKK